MLIEEKTMIKNKKVADKIRCAWVPSGDALYEAYHDREWGVAVEGMLNLVEV